MFTRKIATAATVFVLMSCGSQANDMDSAAPESLEGELRLAGAEPMTMVMLRPTSGGQEVRLQGALVEELRRLTGVVVAVTGTMGASDMQGFEVTSYEITSVQGRRPTVGTLVSRDGNLWLEGESNVRLMNVPSGLRTQTGSKVWVLGTMTDGMLRLESYGVIREP